MMDLIPDELIEWTYAQNRSTIVTTSFGKHSAVLLHMVAQINPNATVVWVDTQFNTSSTIQFKNYIIERLNLSVHVYTGEQWLKEIPLIDTSEYVEFVEQIKLAPFRLAVQDLQPEFWITGLRREQTQHRQGLKQIDQVDGITKICPLLDWTDSNMENYLTAYDLTNELRYFDPTKVHDYRECGLHTNFHTQYSVVD